MKKIIKIIKSLSEEERKVLYTLILYNTKVSKSAKTLNLHRNTVTKIIKSISRKSLKLNHINTTVVDDYFTIQMSKLSDKHLDAVYALMLSCFNVKQAQEIIKLDVRVLLVEVRFYLLFGGEK